MTDNLLRQLRQMAQCDPLGPLLTAAADEIERLQAWKAEASTVLGYWVDTQGTVRYTEIIRELKGEK